MRRAEGGASKHGAAALASLVLALGLILALTATARAGEVVFSPQHEPPTEEDGWQAGTCIVPTCVPNGPVEGPLAEFFEQAAGHPPWGMTQFIVRHEEGAVIPGDPHEEPEVDMKDIRVDLPVGLSVNPGATPQCAAAHPSECATQQPLSAVGESWITVSPQGVPLAPPIEVKAVVYNLKPLQGEPARFGFTVEAIPGFELIPPQDVFLEADVAWDNDYHEGFTIEVPKSEGLRLLKNRLVFRGKAGSAATGYFLTTPSTCFDPAQATFEHTYSTYARADSLQNPDPSWPDGSPFVEAKLPPGTSPKECGTIPFRAGLAVAPETTQVDSPAGARSEVQLPIEPDANGQETSTMRAAVVTLPAGMGLNASAANGLQACTDAQFGQGTENPVACPPASKVGTVTISTPPLPEGPLTGNVYVGEQKSRDPMSGEEFRIFVDAESPRYGVSVRLVGNVAANPGNGQLTATFDQPARSSLLRGGKPDNLPHGLPQVPFSTFKLDFDDGARAPLSSPPVCGPNTATSWLTPWSGGVPATPSAKFTLASLPGGGACPATLAARPFAPTFAANPRSAEAATFTPFSLHVTRGDGQQELKGVDVTLPEGATAKLAGVAYCPAAAIGAAASRGGRSEAASPSCPAASRVGAVTVEAGTGSSPLKIDGNAYLAGPYDGAPVSLVAITPALAGPYDLGTVVVQVPLFVDPETAQIHTVTRAIPHVFGGTKLDIRSVLFDVNRREFTLDGTNCRAGAVAGAVLGGGGDPANPAAFSAFPVSDPFQATDCKRLKFRPKLYLRLFGATHRTQHPRLRATLKARKGDANIGRASVGLPHALFLDQSSLSKICTRVQFTANQCPKKSVYGRARAFTPLLDKPLEGPVYLRASDNTLPDMVAHLKGQVDVDLVGRIDSFHGGIRTTFDRVPDVPVSKFTLVLPGGKHGLLVASTNLCKKPVKAVVRFKAQNGKRVHPRTRLRTPCHKRHRHSGKHGHRKHHDGDRHHGSKRNGK